jgi:hypothetical protein
MYDNLITDIQTGYIRAIALLAEPLVRAFDIPMVETVASFSLIGAPSSKVCATDEQPKDFLLLLNITRDCDA